MNTAMATASTQSGARATGMLPPAPIADRGRTARSSESCQGQYRVSICIPAFNEAGTIEDTVKEAVAALAAVPGKHEIVVVDDGSTDDTWTLLLRLAERFPMLRAIRHARNRGCSASLQAAVEAARGEYLFETAADGQWRMAELPPMLAAIEDGNDVVIGVRRQKQYAPWRKAVSAAYNLLVAALWGKHFGDLGSIRMTRASLWKRVPFGSRSAFGSAERLLLAYRNGARITTVPVDHRLRAAGRSSFAALAPIIRAVIDLGRFWLSPRSRCRLRCQPTGTSTTSGTGGLPTNS